MKTLLQAILTIYFAPSQLHTSLLTISAKSI